MTCSVYIPNVNQHCECINYSPARHRSEFLESDSHEWNCNWLTCSKIISATKRYSTNASVVLRDSCLRIEILKIAKCLYNYLKETFITHRYR